ncbi:MAG: hypothetical protein OEV21_00550 [Thermoplasmata archaeon]|nr:hypothetical protein [Thermoplasmata archaeon]
MDSDKIKDFLVLYFAILMPIILLLITLATGANLLIFLLLLGWIVSGFMIVFLPTHPESTGR